MTKLRSSEELLSFFRAPKGTSPVSMYYDILYDVSVKIHDYRLKHSMTQTDLANQLSVSQAMVAKYESGDYNFTLETLCNVFSKLNISIGVRMDEISFETFSDQNIAQDASLESNQAYWEQAGGAA